MTLQQSITGRPISETDFVLATDLDGTFLGGTDDDRRTLYDWIEANRSSIGLIFVTGRDPEFILEMCSENGLPWPEFVVGDVGTTIAHVTTDGRIAPIGPLEEDIAHRWGDSGPRVRDALKDVRGLELQPTSFRYRVSYYYDPETFEDATHDLVAELGFDTLVSDDKYFDVLPKGVSKGPSLLRLVEHLDLSPDRVLAAGDTMNDFSMLTCGLPAVAVGGSEAPLLAALEGHDKVHRAEPVGAAGILDAVRAFNLHPTP
ncbi:HAD hydrolase family protein [Alphaproteobacteria bacterium GH1-50]|uniref:HAD hydrolase family protein n=1 Tax=Kangsaoukella pontilimi TaxID=2691042 RepID=A0A7C9MB94_9RHOB|nr:HAD family hydrolase [Kangsaoukella pontilimi]MXQ06332.1 HAD hydrolase family protein [Kangsaoukella pontilimi]